jgi:hypothetical protein
MNVAVVDPAGTVMLAGTFSGSLPDNDTAAPPAEAAAVNPTVPVTEFPPTTLDALSEIEETAAPAVTVRFDD